MGLPRKQKLLGTDFKLLLGNAQKLNFRRLLVLYKLNQNKQAKLGLIIGKRAVSFAHDRNRIKRVIKESFRQQNLSGVDIVVIARRQCDKLNKLQLRQDIDQLWKRLSNSLYNVLSS